MTIKNKTRPKFNPSWIFYVAISFLILSLLAVYLIDYLNAFQSRDFLINKLDVPYFWYHWFLIPLEKPLQWYILGATLLFFILNAGIAYERNDKRIYKFWLLTGIGVILMFAEDAGDVRHALRHYVERLTGEITYGFIGSTFELLYFATIAFIIIYAAYKFRDVYWNHIKTRKYLIIAYILYAIAVPLSFAGAAYRTVTGVALYDLAGKYFMNLLFVTNHETQLIYEHAKEFARVDFLLMDMLVEESIEFIGASALLVAGVAFFMDYARRKVGSSDGASSYNERQEFPYSADARSFNPPREDGNLRINSFNIKQPTS